MQIRTASERDIPALNKLLRQVLDVHQSGRPDLFREGAKKYTDDQLCELLASADHPIFVAEEEGRVLGYAFCEHQQEKDSNILTDVRTLYIDDICIDEGERGKHIGKAIYQYVCDYARREGFYRITLNVWSCNPSALRFYEAMGLVPYKHCLEQIL